MEDKEIINYFARSGKTKEDLLERCYEFLENLPCYDEELKRDLDNYFCGESEE